MKKVSKRSVLVLVFFACLVFALQKTFVTKRPSDIAKLLKSIPSEDRENLDFFVRFLFQRSQFGYVLFGTKPMAFEGYFEPSKSPTLFQTLSHTNLKLRASCKTWIKYKHLFPLKKYSLLYADNEDGYREIVLIHKASFVSVVNQNIESFRRVLGSDISGELLLKKIEKREKPWNEVIQNHDALMGILLGYGKRNAWLFHRKKHLPVSLQKSTSPKEEPLYLRKRLAPFAERDVLSLVKLPMFLADLSDPETQALKAKYTQQRKCLTKISRENFVEAVLKELTSTP